MDGHVGWCRRTGAPLPRARCEITGGKTSGAVDTNTGMPLTTPACSPSGTDVTDHPGSFDAFGTVVSVLEVAGAVLVVLHLNPRRS